MRTKPFRTAFELLLLLAAALAATAVMAGCSGHGGRHHHDDPPPPPPPVLEEIEPNDSLAYPDFIGGVDSSSHFFIEGSVDAFGLDYYDYFELVAEEPIGVDFYLHGWSPFADVDLCIYDPDTGHLVACYDSFGNESGFFTVDYPGKAFTLRVETFVDDTGYDLELVVWDHPGLGAPGASAGDGISFPEGRPAPRKDEHRRDAPPRDLAPAPERMALRELLDA